MQLIYHALVAGDHGITPGAVRIDGNRIDSILTDPQAIEAALRQCRDTPGAGHTVVDAQGAYLLPGVIDAHVHFRDPGLTHKADIATESAAAVAGGVTSVLDMPNVKPQTTTAEALADKAARYAAHSLVNYGFFFGIDNDNIDEALALPDDAFCGYKIFLGASTGGMLMNDAAKLRRLFGESRRIIAIHSESEAVIRRNIALFQARYGADLPVALHPQIRDAEACYATTLQAVRLAGETGARLHVCHLTTARELALFQAGDIADKQITAEAVIAHLWFSDADYARLGTAIKCNPAVKSPADRDALRAALTDGRIDLVATDHAPHAWAEKQGNALTAASGMPSIQYSLPAMLELQREGFCTPADVVRLMCHNPALRYGLDRRGFIRPGYYADLTLVSPHVETTVTGSDIRSKCGWSPFEGTTFHHTVMGTWVNGRRVYTAPAAGQTAATGQELAPDAPHAAMPLHYLLPN